DESCAAGADMRAKIVPKIPLGCTTGCAMAIARISSQRNGGSCGSWSHQPARFGSPEARTRSTYQPTPSSSNVHHGVQENVQAAVDITDWRQCEARQDALHGACASRTRINMPGDSPICQPSSSCALPRPRLFIFGAHVPPTSSLALHLAAFDIRLSIAAAPREATLRHDVRNGGAFTARGSAPHVSAAYLVAPTVPGRPPAQTSPRRAGPRTLAIAPALSHPGRPAWERRRTEKTIQTARRPLWT
ncbi:hypothetical protein EVG20_g9524, partial [Dentipellis fragilis]